MENLEIEKRVISRIEVFTNEILKFTEEAKPLLDKVENRQALRILRSLQKIQASGFQIKSAVELEIKIDEIIKNHKAANKSILEASK